MANKASPQQILTPQNNYFIPNVPPLALTNQRLGGGKYCLGVDSTIPFISFQGGGFAQKIISWGEMIEIPKGQTVTVKNESFMQGDIVINSGHDFAAKPERISTPLRLETLTPLLPGTLLFKGEFPADTRRCRRAYLNFNIVTVATSIFINVLGKSKKHSFPAIDSLPGVGPYSYQSSVVILPFTQMTSINLGYGQNIDKELPQGLTDQAEFYIISAAPQTANINSLFMYVLEY